MSDQDAPGFGRDQELEQSRERARPAAADLDGRETPPPHIDYAPDPDAEDAPTAPNDPEADGAPAPDATHGDDVPKTG